MIGAAVVLSKGSRDVFEIRQHHVGKSQYILLNLLAGLMQPANEMFIVFPCASHGFPQICCESPRLIRACRRAHCRIGFYLKGFVDFVRKG